MDALYYGLIFNWIHQEIGDFQNTLTNGVGAWAGAIGMTLVTLWIMIQGYRMITGQLRESMMATVVNMAKVAVIVTAATTMAAGGYEIRTFLSDTMPKAINSLVSNSSGSPQEEIGKNLAYTQLAMAAIGAVEVPPGDISNNDAKSRASLIALLGVAGPPMTAGAILLLYEVAMALFVGLGPIFILCLLFEQTKSLFSKWLMYGIGTMFSLAVLNVVVLMVMKLTFNVAAALWATQVITQLTGASADGFTNQAMQQGGIGLLMTVLLVSTPPMAAMFFNGVLGGFQPYAQVNGGGAVSRPGPQGQPPGSYGGGGYGAAGAGGGNQPAVDSKGGDSSRGTTPDFGTQASTNRKNTAATDSIKKQPSDRDD